MPFGRKLTTAGVVLLVWAFWNATDIPAEANNDFSRLIQAVGGGMSHSAEFPDVYKRMSADRRFLQNLYVGAAGLICLATGLSTMRHDAAPVKIDLSRIPADGNPDSNS